MGDSTEKEEVTVGSGEWDPERVAEAYEQAIKDYEEYYRQQGIQLHGGPQYDPYSYYYSQGYTGSPYAEEPADDLDQTLAEYEQSLQLLEQVQGDFGSSLRYIESLQGKEREDYIKEWKEYLQGTLETGKQLADSIDELMQSLSEKNS